MNSLQDQQMWELMRSHQAEMLKEAQQEYLARMVEQPKSGWLNNLFGRQTQSPTIALNPSATPELG